MDVNQDYIFPTPIDDTISCMKWYPEKDNNILATCGWDSKVRIFNVSYQPNNQQTQANFNSNLVYTGAFENPLLSLTWLPSGTPSIITGLIYSII